MRRTRGTSRSSTSCARRITSTTTHHCRGWAREALWAAFPDTVHIIEEMIAERDLVVTRLRGRGTFKGEILGIPPNNKVIEITGISIHRVAGGKLVEHWANADLLSFLQQMGAIPSLEPDTSATH